MVQTLVLDTVKYNRSNAKRKIAKGCPMHCQRFRNPPFCGQTWRDAKNYLYPASALTETVLCFYGQDTDRCFTSLSLCRQRLNSELKVAPAVSLTEQAVKTLAR